jgi:hypothetical protein
MGIKYTMDESEIAAMNRLHSYANRYADGHFSLLKFTTNYKCEIGFQDYNSEADKLRSMTTGPTLDIVINNEIDRFMDTVFETERMTGPKVDLNLTNNLQGI